MIKANGSRTSLLLLLVTAVVLILITLKKRTEKDLPKWIFPAVLCVLAVACYVLVFTKYGFRRNVYHYLKNIEDLSALSTQEIMDLLSKMSSHRFYIWKTSLEAIAVHPFRGYGLKSGNFTYTVYRGFSNSHNLLINTLLNYVPPRVITVGICWFVSAMTLVSMLLGALLVRGKPRWDGHVKMIFCAILLCFLMNRFYSENISEIRNIRWSWNVRNTLLEQYKGESEPVKTCSLPSPGSFREDILVDPADEFNKAAALFYEIPEISADHRCPPWGEFFLPEDKYN